MNIGLQDTFRTLKSTSEGYYMDRGSKFHSYAMPVTSEWEVSDCLQKLKKLHPKARHFCSAFRLFPDASLERSNDDGEPSGSAGKPILGQLIRQNLTNVLIVVVRYFGGTKLGVPGLIEAYKTSAANALNLNEVIEKKLYAILRLELAYLQHPSLINHLKQADIPVIHESFDDKAVITIAFPKSSLHEDFKMMLHQFSKMDFAETQAYLDFLNMKATIPGEDLIL